MPRGMSTWRICDSQAAPGRTWLHSHGSALDLPIPTGTPDQGGFPQGSAGKRYTIPTRQRARWPFQMAAPENTRFSNQHKAPAGRFPRQHRRHRAGFPLGTRQERSHFQLAAPAIPGSIANSTGMGMSIPTAAPRADGTDPPERP